MSWLAGYFLCVCLFVAGVGIATWAFVPVVPTWFHVLAATVSLVQLPLWDAARTSRPGELAAGLRAVLSRTAFPRDWFLFSRVCLALILPVVTGAVAAGVTDQLTWRLLIPLVVVPCVFQALGLYIEALEKEARQ